MQLCVVGVNHKTTPVSIRGKLAIGASRLQEALRSLHDRVPSGVVLCTCNRTEVYTVAGTSVPLEQASLDFLNARANLSPRELMSYCYVYRDEAAVRHLFQVASGLDSMIIGEFEVLGQMRRALEEAEKSQLVGLPLLSLFRQAVRVGRRVRAETDISKNALSVSSVAVDLATKVVGDIRQRKIVVIGAGEAGSLVARTCRERGASPIVVVSRSEKKGTALARTLGGVWAPMDNLELELITAEIAVSCTGAPHTVVKLPTVKDAMSQRSERPLVVIDIAVPPDVQPEVKELPNVFLYDIDDLTGICDLNHQQREKAVRSVELIVEDEVKRVVADWRALEVRPVISALMMKAEKVRRSQLEMTLKKLSRLSEDDQFHLEAMTRAIVQKILHEPIETLKAHGDSREEYVQLVSKLFGLEEEIGGEEDCDGGDAGQSPGPGSDPTRAGAADGSLSKP
jgi:glutamyl-tRNA reductase